MEEPGRVEETQDDNLVASAPGAACKRDGAAAPGAAMNTMRLVRTAIAGLLMGTANLIPGVSGGTMILAMGLYQEFIDSVADVTAFRLSLRRLLFLGVLGTFALAAIVGLAKVILLLLFHYPTAMFALFIGLTLGGAPTLLRSLRPIRADVVISTSAGFALMICVLLLKHVQGGEFPHNAAMDLAAGVIGATTMVLPGVSGSYMLLVLDQYERVIQAVGDPDLAVIAPVGIGAIVGIIGLSNILKFLLHRHARPTIGVLLGILLGSVLGLWPFGKVPGQKALERRTPRELLAFAERWQIPGVAEVVPPGVDVTALANGTAEQLQHELAHAVEANWDRRKASSYAAAHIVRAAVCVVVGLIITLALARRQPVAGA